MKVTKKINISVTNKVTRERNSIVTIKQQLSTGNQEKSIRVDTKFMNRRVIPLDIIHYIIIQTTQSFPIKVTTRVTIIVTREVTRKGHQEDLAILSFCFLTNSMATLSLVRVSSTFRIMLSVAETHNAITTVSRGNWQLYYFN